MLRNYVSENGAPGVRLRLEDIIKMGRCQYIVKELVGEMASPQDVHIDIAGEHNAEPVAEATLPEGEFLATINADAHLAKEEKKDANKQAKEKEKEKEKTKDSDDEIRCRICLGNESTDANPLIASPCKCIGTVQLIHTNCLQQWLKSKVTEKHGEFMTSYSWKQFECDVCKAKYPSTIRLLNSLIGVIHCPNGRSLEIFQVQKPPSHYMTLQTINNTDITMQNCTHFFGYHLLAVFVILLDKRETLKVGRGHNNEVRINDISVSRLHAEIRKFKGEYYLCDLNSKFGTLALLRKPVQVKAGQLLNLQAGRTLMNFTIKRPFCTCFGGE